MVRITLAIALIAGSLGEASAFDESEVQGVSLYGFEQGAYPTDHAAADAKDADRCVTPAEVAPLGVEAVILATGETVDLR